MPSGTHLDCPHSRPALTVYSQGIVHTKSLNHPISVCAIPETGVVADRNIFEEKLFLPLAVCYTVGEAVKVFPNFRGTFLEVDACLNGSPTGHFALCRSRAGKKAVGCGHNYIGTEHILLICCYKPQQCRLRCCPPLWMTPKTIRCDSLPKSCRVRNRLKAHSFHSEGEENP